MTEQMQENNVELSNADSVKGQERKVNILSIVNKVIESMNKKGINAAAIVTQSGKVLPFVDKVDSIASNLRFAFESDKPLPKITSLEYATRALEFVESLYKEYKTGILCLAYTGESRKLESAGFIDIASLYEYFQACKKILALHNSINPKLYKRLSYVNDDKPVKKGKKGKESLVLAIPKVK